MRQVRSILAVEQYVLSHAQTKCLKGSDWIEVAVTKYLSDEDLQPVSGSKAEPATSGKMALAARTEGKWLHSHGSRVAWTLERADSSQVRVKLYHFFVQGGRHESPVYFLYMLH
jgi:hypothetical protein